MAEVNTTEQELEPDIRPSSRHHQHHQHQQQHPHVNEHITPTRSTQDESLDPNDHAVRRGTDTSDSKDVSVTPPSQHHHQQQQQRLDHQHHVTATLHHDASIVPGPHEVDVPPAQKGYPSAPMKSMFQRVIHDNKHTANNKDNNNNEDVATLPITTLNSNSEPNLGSPIGVHSGPRSRVDEKDYVSYPYAQIQAQQPRHPLASSFRLKKPVRRASSFSSSFSPKNDLHARFGYVGQGQGGGGSGSGEKDGHTISAGIANNNNNLNDASAGPTPGVGGIGLIGPIRPTKSMAELWVPTRKLGSDPTWAESVKNTLKSSYMVYLIPLVPVAWALHFSGQSDVVVFVFSFLAVIPLAALLSFATEQLALRTGDALGGLLNATFGNAVELLISILALAKGEIGLVQASMIGSILSNTLLVLGCCFLAGGLRFHEQIYSTSASQLQISLLGIAMCALVLPAAFQFSLSSLSTVAVTRPVEEITDLSSSQRATLLSISRGVSFMLLSTYAVYLVFQLYTHAYLFKRRPRANKRPHHEPGEPHPNHAKVLPISEWVAAVRSRGSASSSSDGLTPMTTRDTAMAHHHQQQPHHVGEASGAASTAVDLELGANAGPGAIPMHQRNNNNNNDTVLEFAAHSTTGRPDEDDEEEEEIPLVKTLFALFLLLAVTGITGVTAEFLVDSIDGVTAATDISTEFVGLILLPIVGNVPEHVCAVTVSIKDKLDLSLSIAVGSTIQVALGILPLLVLIGWAIGQPMSLFFDTFQIISLAVSLIIVAFAISDGRSCFAEGYILIMTYFIFALCSWYYDPSKIM